jgi:ATP-dependent protease ClpP protease subunit
MMIHEALGIGMGDAKHMREYANALDKQTDNIAGIYAERSSRSADSSHSCAASVPQTTPNDATGRETP